MPSWNELLAEIDKYPGEWIRAKEQEALRSVSQKRGNRNVIFYASGFMQKPDAPSSLTQITFEDVNGFMSVMYGMDWQSGLTLILHTPGGITSAAETVVSYLHQKFSYIEVIVPTLAMSAGTMISLGANKIIMGRQSQLGPIDPQMPIGGRFVSAQAVVDQFDKARNDISINPITAHVWAPILQSMGPALLQEAQNSLGYGERMVASWLASRMLFGTTNSQSVADQAAKFFRDASVHLSHGRRIDRDEARSNGIIVEDLEDDQELQDSVLTLYHLATITFEKSPATKYLHSNYDRRWIKQWAPTR